MQQGWTPVIAKLKSLPPEVQREKLGQMSEATRGELIQAMRAGVTPAAKTVPYMDAAGATQQTPLQAPPFQAGQGASRIRKPLTAWEQIKNFGRDTVEALPAAGTIIGGMVGNVPGAAVGAMAGQTATNLAKAAGMGLEPPPDTALGELADVTSAGAKGAFEQFIGGKVAGVLGSGGMTPAKLVLPKATREAQAFSDAVGGRRSVQLQNDIQKSFESAKAHLKRSEKEFLKGPVKTKAEAIEVAKDAYNRIYTEEIQSLIDATPSVDFRPVATKLKRAIPSHFTDAERLKAEKTIDSVFDKVLSGKDAEALRQKLRAEDRVNLAKNSYERAAVGKTARGWTLEKMYEGARAQVIDTVKERTGHDISESLAKYGAVSDVTQRMLSSPVDPTFVQRIEGTYFTGSPYNITGRATQLLGGMMKSSDRYIKNAFAGIPDIPPVTPGLLSNPTPPAGVTYKSPGPYRLPLGPGGPADIRNYIDNPDVDEVPF